MRGAAAVDPEIAALRARLQEQRFQNMLQFVSWVAANGPLRAGMSEEDGAAIVWTPHQPRDPPAAAGRPGMDGGALRGLAGRDPDPTLLP